MSKEVAKKVTKGVNTITHETEALVDHISNLETNEEKEKAEQKLKDK